MLEPFSKICHDPVVKVDQNGISLRNGKPVGMACMQMYRSGERNNNGEVEKLPYIHWILLEILFEK